MAIVSKEVSLNASLNSFPYLFSTPLAFVVSLKDLMVLYDMFNMVCEMLLMVLNEDDLCIKV